MSRITKILFLLFISFFAQAQSSYFQQEVNYKIEVTLDDQAHILTGKIDIEYTNNSPNALESLYFHLWPNAYSSRRTAFSKHQIQQKHSEFYFAKEEDLGNISGLKFMVNNQPLDLSYPNKDNPDIAIVRLNQPLQKGKTITISTPFTVKIPKSFSRLGHVESSYQITQWYPKPAVLDQYGWHPMPYLRLGEFYSEFGSFDVTITLPKNYVVGATGQLQTKSEIEFLNQRVKEAEEVLKKDDKKPDTMTFPPSDTEAKTIRYTAQKVHDFAWFADKRFNVLQSEVTLKSGKTVKTWAMFPNNGWDSWQKATDYLDRSILHYSDLVGEYPYPHATAVQSALSAGAGMEYPMITVIGNEHGRQLDNLITHEVGHNWFYGILGSNERNTPWLDEGVNTYYEQRYMNMHYEPSKINELKLVYPIKARMHEDVSPNYPITKMSETTYGLSAYAKPSLSLAMLEAYVGTKTFDKAMKDYYQTWKFKHPTPNDLKDIWAKHTNKNLDWFFNDIIFTTKTMDYKILKIKKSGDKTNVTIRNNGTLKGPLFLFGIKNGIVVDSMIIDGFVGNKVIEFPKNQYDEIQIDRHQKTIDIYPSNNTKGTNLKLKFVFGLDDDKDYIFWLPVYGWNKYDKSMLGLLLHNDGIVKQKLYYEVAAMYSFGAKTITGKGLLKYPIYTKGFFHKIVPSISFKRFSYFTNTKDNYTQTYNRVAPGIQFHLRKQQNRKQSISLIHEIIQTQQPVYSNQGDFLSLTDQINQYDRLNYYYSKSNAIQYTKFGIGLEYSSYDNYSISKNQFLKLHWNSHFNFKYSRRKSVGFGLQGGYFLKNTARYASSFNNGLVLGSLSAIGSGQDDYAFRSLYLGRSEQENFLSQQILINSGGLKIPNLNGPIGHSNDWMMNLNVYGYLPVRIPIKPYFDMSFYGAPKDANATKLEMLYSGGIQLDLKFIKINFPIFNSKELNLLLKGRKEGNYLGQISYSIDLKYLSPNKIEKEALKQIE